MKFSNIECQNIIDLYKSGSSISAIASSFSASRKTIRLILKRNNIHIISKPQKKNISIDINILKKEYEGGLSLKEISKKYNQPLEKTRKELIASGTIMRNNTNRSISKISKEILYDMYNNQFMNILDISKKLNISNSTISKWMKEYNIPLRGHSINTKLTVVNKTKETNISRYGIDCLFSDEEFSKRCRQSRIDRHGSLSPKCTNKEEKEVISFLNSLGCNFIHDITILNGKELDGYDKELNIAIEYCGLYWHNEIFQKDNSYHYKKYKMCREKGIKLITIWDYEWKTKKSQVKSFLKSLVNKNKNRIHARKCTIKEISLGESEYFLNLYHIQGYAGNNTISAYGIFYDDILYGCLTIGRHHRKSNEFVLSRLCFANDFTIIGGASKLLKYALKDYPSIITWSDNRWTSGNVYEKIGFIKDREYKQDYFYININNTSEIYSKQSKQKKYLHCKDGQTEHDRCLELGLVRVYDCGKTRWRISI